MKTIRLAACVLGAALALPCTAGSLELARRGAAPDYSIELPAKPTSAERHAAEELQTWTEKLVGVKLPIVAGKVSGKAIALNRERPDPKLGEDGFTLATKGEDVEISGGGRGIHYGVYELLETYGGIGWLDTDLTDIPKTDVFTVPRTLKDVQRPAFVRRCHDWRRIQDHHDFAVRSRENHFYRPERFGGSHPNFDGPLGWCHTFNWLIRPDEYFADHPEYFSFFRGKRQKSNSQLCLTNPDVLRIVTEKVVARVKANRERKTGVKYYGVSQNDWNGYCECTNCAAIDAREGSHAGALFWFVNKVAEEVEKVDPEAIVETLAYMYSRRPPKTIRPRHNVMPMLCSIECDFSKGMGTSRFRENADFREDVERWRAISKHLMIWDYTANWRATPCPQHNLTTLQDNAKYYRDHGVTELFYEGWSSESPSPEFSALKAWLCGKMLWNPDRPLRPLVERFVRGYYGKGAPYVMDYIDLLERQPIDEAKTPFIYRTQAAEMPWSEAFLKESQALWRKAEDAVRGESPQIASNVLWGAFGADYTRLAAYLHRNPSWLPFMASRTMAAKVDRATFDEMRALGVKLARILDENPAAVVSSKLNDDRFKGHIRAIAESVPPSAASADRVTVQDWAFTYPNYPPSKTIFREKDAAATDGRILHAKKAGSGWQMTFAFKNAVALDEGGHYRLRARMKASAAASAGLFDRSVRKDVAHASIKPSADYTWSDLGEWTAKGTDCILWIDPRDSDLCLDCLEIVREEK